jgi:hypothetical protein
MRIHIFLVVGRGLWAMGRGLWAMGRGLWAVGCGLWAVGCGSWAVGHGPLHCTKAIGPVEVKRDLGR